MSVVSTVRIKVFQKASYMQIEDAFNAWVAHRDRILRKVISAENSDATIRTTSLETIPPNTSLNFDSSLQKYILTVLYHTYVDTDTDICLDVDA